jgi:hypothetical protein
MTRIIMRAIVICPDLGTMHEHVLPDDSGAQFLGELKKLLKCEWVEATYPLRNHTCWGDEEARLNGQCFRTGVTVVNNLEYHGRIVVTGGADSVGNTLSATMSMPELKSLTQIAMPMAPNVYIFEMISIRYIVQEDFEKLTSGDVRS